MLAPDTILQNRYRIVRELGHGGMGTVYEAVDQRVNCIVALKETTAGNDAEAKRAFEREASLLANLRQSALPKVMDYFTEGDGDFLVMEFIPGYDLAELLESRESPFPQSQVLRWAFELLRVLDYLHKQEPPILHRDIKPSNLKLTKNGEVFLLDFGLAKGALGQMPTLAASRSVRGYTPIYASLEQIHGHGTDPRSDLYSLGATLYHLLSGIPPVDAPTRFHVIEDGDTDPLTPIHKVNPQASPNVAGVIHQTMALRRKDRPVSAAEMSKALRNAAEEDERNAAEEEYARAEERRRLRAERAAGPAPATKGSEKKPEPKPKSDEPAREEPRAATGSTAPQPRVPAREARTPELPVTVVAPTERPAAHAERPATPPAQSPPGVSTMIAPPPERVAAVPATATNRSHASFAEPAAKKNYTMVIVAAVVVIAAVGGLVFWMMKRSTHQTTGTSSTTDPSTTNSSMANMPRTRTNQTGIEFVLIPPGTFMMGSTNGNDNEKPVHQVTINYSFYMGKYEITQAQWQAVMGSNPSVAQRPIVLDNKHTLTFKDCATCPVENVSWDDAQTFINKMNESNDGFGYRLPTEAEWEYACRAGTTGDYAGDLDAMAWYGNNSGRARFDASAAWRSEQVFDRMIENGGTTHSVGTKLPNAFGLFDMQGNVEEWCQDWSHDSYNGAPTEGSAWLSGGEQKHRVVRGGSFLFDARSLRSAFRNSFLPDSHSIHNGFRLVAVVRSQ